MKCSLCTREVSSFIRYETLQTWVRSYANNVHTLQSAESIGKIGNSFCVECLRECVPGVPILETGPVCTIQMCDQEWETLGRDIVRYQELNPIKAYELLLSFQKSVRQGIFSEVIARSKNDIVQKGRSPSGR